MSLETNVKGTLKFAAVGRKVVTAASKLQFSTVRRLGGLVMRENLGTYRH